MPRLARARPLMETAHPEGRPAMSTSPITRWAGRISLAAATLILTSQLLNLALGLTQNADAGTLTHTLQFALALLAQYVLLLALTGLYTRQATAVGTFGLVGYLVAFLGGLLVAGDWWYEAFAVPQIAIHAPQVLDIPWTQSGSVMAGAIATAISFSLGWVLFGIATLRGRLLPAGPAILMIIGGAVAVLVLDTPYQIPLAVAVGWMGYRLNAAPRDQHEAPAPAPANP
jgi:hypothetical protein